MREKILLLVILLAAAALRVFIIVRDSVPFAYDMGRDLLWAKDITFYHIPTLIGPAASIWGIYFGPLWFYFLSVPLLISGGNPLSAVYLTALMIIFTGGLAYVLFRKYLTKLYALTLSIIILFSFTLINISTFAFHANVLPLLTLALIYFSFLAVVKNSLFISLAFLSSSLMFHADPAPAMVFSFIPLFFFILFKLYKRKDLIRVLVFSFLGYLTPFTFQILFELRNNFVETKSLVSYFRGENPSLSGQLPLFERITNRVSFYFEFFRTSFAGGSSIFAIIFLIFICWGIYKFLKTKNSQKLLILFKINAYSFLITFLIFTFLVTVEIKNWYLYGITILFVFLIVFALYGLRRFKFIRPLLLIIYLVLNVTPFFRSERPIRAKADPAQLSNQLQAIDLIYKDSNNLPFSVYTFTPSIYDHNWQYLFWWQGVKLGRGLPGDFAYLPNQPDYVRNKDVYSRKGEITSAIYLIIENAKENEFYTKNNWFKNFDSFGIVWQKDINNAVTVQKRAK